MEPFPAALTAAELVSFKFDPVGNVTPLSVTVTVMTSPAGTEPPETKTVVFRRTGSVREGEFESPTLTMIWAPPIVPLKLATRSDPGPPAGAPFTMIGAEPWLSVIVITRPAFADDASDMTPTASAAIAA